MLRLVFRVGCRVKHSTHGAAHGSKMLLPGVLQNNGGGERIPQIKRSDLLYVSLTVRIQSEVGEVGHEDALCGVDGNTH